MNNCVSRIAAAVAGTGMLPPVLLKACIDRTWRSTLSERFGGGDWSTLPDAQGQCLWFHGASVGEVGGISPLIKAVRAEFPDLRFLVSTTSLTGKNEALKRELAQSVCLLPHDHPYFVGRVIERAQPRMFVISETELWPNMLFALQREGVPVVLVNGRISDYSFPRYLRIKRLLKPAFLAICRVFAQTQLDADRFSALGFPDERLEVAGSTKYDQLLTEYSENELDALASSFGISLDRPCFVAGSVRAEEDETVIRAFAEASRQVEGLQMIIAPRHPERFEEVGKLLSRHGFAYNRRSDRAIIEHTSVLLLDTLGELRSAYALASFAFVGGSLVDIGGHNPLEPAAYRAPVIVGPHTANVRDAICSLRQVGGVREICGQEDLSEVIKGFAIDPDLKKEVGDAAYRVWQSNLGATEKVMAYLRSQL